MSNWATLYTQRTLLPGLARRIAGHLAGPRRGPAAQMDLGP